MSPDPIGIMGGIRAHAYPENPNSWIDPFGLIRLRHYTSRTGCKAIKATRFIKALDQNKIFNTKAKGKPLSPVDAQDKLGIKKNKGKCWVEYNVEEGEYKKIKNGITGATEYVIDGDISLAGRAPTFSC